MTPRTDTAGPHAAEDLERLLPTDDDVAHFNEKGWWVSPPILDDATLATAVRGAERIYAGEYDTPLPNGATHMGWSPEDGDILRKNDQASLLVHELRAVTMNRVVAAVAARLAGVDGIRLWHDQLLYKPPVPPSGKLLNVGWHTDRQYWLAASSTSMLTAWIPFHEIRSEHGPVMFVDGSHEWDGVTGDFFNPELGTLPELLADRNAHVSEALVPRGGVSFHHCKTIHGSGPNTSTEPRRAIAVHLQDTANHYSGALRGDGTPVRHGLMDLVRTTPTGDPDFADPEVCPQLWP
jgi:ectoine hydroxylase-related dioxygenase (phytanoyl-CoA dioxygenase family)